MASSNRRSSRRNPPSQHHARARLGETSGNTGADAAAGARDHRDVTVEPIEIQYVAFHTQSPADQKHPHNLELSP